MQNRTRGAANMTAAMLISGSIGWFVIASDQPIMRVVFWRCLIGAATLLAICAALGHLKRGVITSRQLAVAALGGAAIVLNWILLFASYSRASISIATAVYNTQPFMLVGLGALFMRERLTASTLSWLCVAFMGMLLVVQVKPDASYVDANYLGGIALALGAAGCYALAAILTKALKEVPPHLIALIHVAVGVVLLTPFGSLRQLPTDLSAWAMLSTIGVVHTGIMYILLYGAIQVLPTNMIGALSFIYPVVAIAVDMLAFEHTLHATQLAGAAAILLAAAGMTLGWKITALRRSTRAPL